VSVLRRRSKDPLTGGFECRWNGERVSTERARTSDVTGFVYQNTHSDITFEAHLSSVRRESRGDTAYGPAEEIVGVENPWRAGVGDEQCCPDRARIEK